MDQQETGAEINRLYWESDESVGTIADRVGVSRRAMYDSIQPRPAPGACPSCGGSLGFRNRTALQRREAECLTCGVEIDASAARNEAGTARSAAAGSAAGSAQASAGGEGPTVERQREAGEPSPIRSVPPPARAPVLSGLLLAGMATGAAAAFVLRRR